MIGLLLLLGGGNMPSECFCQVPGQAGRIQTAKFQELLEALPNLRRVLLRYMQALITQIVQSAACNRMQSCSARARSFCA